MKNRLLRILECPACGGSNWDLVPFKTDRSGPTAEVEDALLNCSCGALYPVVGGIPRMLPDSMRQYDAYFTRYGILPEKASRPEREIEAFHKAQKSTERCFNFECLRYQAGDHEESVDFFRRSTGLRPDAVRGKLVLDAGCGMGRFLEVAASWGAEVVGIDLSRGVERAWRESRYRDRIHLIQGDIMKPPIQSQAFDIAFSIGVLHHTPNTRAAFQSVANLVRPGGRIAIWVYRTFRPETPAGLHRRLFALLCQIASDGTRVFTTRMPYSMLHYLCYAAIPLGWLKLEASGNWAAKVAGWPFLLLPVSPHPRWQVRVSNTFDWLAPRYQWKHTSDEVRAWFQAEGLSSIETLGVAVSVAGMKPMLNGAQDSVIHAEPVDAIPAGPL